MVISVDEKPHIQALRAQGWLRLPNGKALTGFSHGYKRHGTTTLFAALNVATGQVKAGHYKRRRESLDFMNEVLADYPGQQIHVILDNLNTHKLKEDRWLARHKNVHLHYTPTCSSWLNQIECWFSILSHKALKGASFTSPQQVRNAIDRFIATYNKEAAPFEWRKGEVHPVKPKKKCTDLCNKALGEMARMVPGEVSGRKRTAGTGWRESLGHRGVCGEDRSSGGGAAARGLRIRLFPCD